MHHLEYLKANGHDGASLAKTASGRFYTGELVGRKLAADVVEMYHASKATHERISILEPFAGDGRLVIWFIEEWIGRGFPKVSWTIELWEQDENVLDSCRNRVEALALTHGTVKINARAVDSFREVLQGADFDIVLTNPPWDVIKPDRRELSFLNDQERVRYAKQLKAYDAFLCKHFPLSQPAKKFAGWGTNLSRVGLEVSLRYLGRNGVCGIVMPASFAADTQTSRLRAWVINNFQLGSVIHYPAEVNQFDGADTGAVAVCIRSAPSGNSQVYIGSYSQERGELDGQLVELDIEVLSNSDFVLPVAIGPFAFELMAKMSNAGSSWGRLEAAEANRLWAGREIDETRISEHLVPLSSGAPPFVKGRMINRFSRVHADYSLSKPKWKAPRSTQFNRIAWRDVSRPSQRRRMMATIIDAGTVSGNSVGIAYFENSNEVALLSLLGIMNSTSFELILRASLATGHISLSTLRKMPVPSFEVLAQCDELAALVSDALASEDDIAASVDAFVAARIYRLDASTYDRVLSQFTALNESDRDLMLAMHGDFWSGQ